MRTQNNWQFDINNTTWAIDDLFIITALSAQKIKGPTQLSAYQLEIWKLKERVLN